MPTPRVFFAGHDGKGQYDIMAWREKMRERHPRGVPIEKNDVTCMHCSPAITVLKLSHACNYTWNTTSAFEYVLFWKSYSRRRSSPKHDSSSSHRGRISKRQIFGLQHRHDYRWNIARPKNRIQSIWNVDYPLT